MVESRTWTGRFGLRACLLLTSLALLLPGSAGAKEVDSISVNGLELTSCDVVVGPGFRSWCGVIARPLQPQGPATVPIHFALVLPRGVHADQARLAEILRRPVIAAFEGGPGYGGMDSGYAYAQMLGPLMDQRALFVMDARGTGRSSAINCPTLQTGSVAFLKAAAACARRLSTTVDDYGTATAADDAAAIISRLGFTQADIYGDSYGTFMAQVLAGRHPELARSLVLDGAYPVAGEDAWYSTQGPALTDALEQVCEADPKCSGKSVGTVRRLETFLKRLRRDPIHVTAPGGDARRHSVRITAPDVLDVAFNGTYVDSTYREFDQAVRAALAGDALPIARLVAEYQYPGTPEEKARVNSSGQFLAVTCQDYPQLYDMTQSTRVRKAQLRAAIQRAREATPTLFAPFTIDDYVDSSWETLYDCLTWARFPPGVAGAPTPPAGTYPDIPVLVISGSLDTITTTAEGDMVAAQFPRAQVVEVPFGVHVQAMGNSVPCAADLVQRFFTDPSAFLAPSPATCSAPRPRLHSTFARTFADMGEARGAAITAADVVNRVRAQPAERGLGLRGGTWRVKRADDEDVVIELSDVRFFQDLPVTGDVTWTPATGGVQASLLVRGGRVTAAWSDASETAVVRGSIDGAAVNLRIPAP